MRKTVINAGTLTIAGSGKRKEKGRGGWPRGLAGTIVGHLYGHCATCSDKMLRSPATNTLGRRVLRHATAIGPFGGSKARVAHHAF